MSETKIVKTNDTDINSDSENEQSSSIQRDTNQSVHSPPSLVPEREIEQIGCVGILIEATQFQKVTNERESKNMNENDEDKSDDNKNENINK